MLLVSISENNFNVSKGGCWAVAEVCTLLSVTQVFYNTFSFWGGMHFFINVSTLTPVIVTHQNANSWYCMCKPTQQ